MNSFQLKNWLLFVEHYPEIQLQTGVSADGVVRAQNKCEVYANVLTTGVVTGTKRNGYRQGLFFKKIQ